jgi:hypothetical protein
MEKVAFLGAPDDYEFALAMNAVDICIFPYLEVGQSGSGPVSIAVELGKPVIVSRTKAFIEFARYYPKNLRWSISANHIQLAQAIQRLSKPASRQAPINYNNRTLARFYGELIRGVAGRPRETTDQDAAQPSAPPAEAEPARSGSSGARPADCEPSGVSPTGILRKTARPFKVFADAPHRLHRPRDRSRRAGRGARRGPLVVAADHPASGGGPDRKRGHAAHRGTGPAPRPRQALGAAEARADRRRRRSAKMIDDESVHLAVVRTDVAMPWKAQTVAIMHRDVALLLTVPATGITQVRGCRGRTSASSATSRPTATCSKPCSPNTRSPRPT